MGSILMLVAGVVIGYFLSALIFGATQELALREAYKAGRIDGTNAVYRQYMDGEEDE